MWRYDCLVTSDCFFFAVLVTQQSLKVIALSGHAGKTSILCFRNVLKLVFGFYFQFDPDLVLISAGFDSARGDPKVRSCCGRVGGDARSCNFVQSFVSYYYLFFIQGLCDVTPEGYHHLTRLLMNLANGKVAIVLEVIVSTSRG